jgi:hypothetical protein
MEISVVYQSCKSLILVFLNVIFVDDKEIWLKKNQSFLLGLLTRYVGTSFCLKTMKHPNGYETTLSVYGESSAVTHCDRVMDRSNNYCLLRYINNLVVNKYMTWMSGYDGHRNNYPVRYRYPAQTERFRIAIVPSIKFILKVMSAMMIPAANELGSFIITLTSTLY